MAPVKELHVTRMPTVTELNPRDADSANVKTVGREMDELVLVSLVLFFL